MNMATLLKSVIIYVKDVARGRETEALHVLVTPYMLTVVHAGRQPKPEATNSMQIFSVGLESVPLAPRICAWWNLESGAGAGNCTQTFSRVGPQLCSLK